MKYCLFKTTSILIILLVIFILGCHKKNRPPHTPYTPAGPSVGKLNIKYNFSSLAIDPDDDSITLRFDWGNGDTTPWSSDWDIWFRSEQTFTIVHSWKYPDTYYVRAQAKDEKDNISEWSMPHCIEINPNLPPNIPSISGPSSGYIETTYQFSSSTTDPDEDSVAIRYDWGNGDTSDWSVWIPSGDSVWMSKEWLFPDTYQLRVQAKDVFSATSDWSLPFSLEIKNQPGIWWILATDSAGWSSRESHASVVFDNKIWVIGGHGRADEVWSSPDGVNWTCETNSAGFGIRDDFPMVIYDDKIWVIGGESGNSSKNDVWCSADRVNWTCVTDSAQWSPRDEHTAVVFDNKMWVLGGKRGQDDNFNDVWYSADGINWICATNSASWSARHDHTSVVFDNKIWVMGGADLSGHLNDVWYSSDGVNWTQATASAEWTGRIAHTSVVFNNKIWVISGSISVIGPVNDVWYSINGCDWIREIPSTIFLPRWDHTSVVFNNKIWVIGGRGSSQYNDVWYREVIEK